MPNWVSNIMYVNGPLEDLDKLAFFLERDIEVHTWNSQLGTSDLVTEHVCFSYMALRNPFEDPYNVTREEYHTVNGVGPSGVTGNTAGNWYNWNGMHWGVKWDACNPERDRSEENALRYSWESPWGPPDPTMFEELAKKFPTLAFSMWYEEEQGWGGEYEIVDGEIEQQWEWDIPECHQDYVDLEKSCQCEYEDDPNYMFDDCPKKLEMAIDSNLSVV